MWYSIWQLLKYNLNIALSVIAIDMYQDLLKPNQSTIVITKDNKTYTFSVANSELNDATINKIVEKVNEK